MLRRLVFWIIMLTLPLQGFAAAAMIHCAPVTQNMGHAHHQANHDQHHADHAGDKASATQSEKCSAGSMCCMGVIATTLPSLTVHTPIGSPVLIGHIQADTPSVIPSGLHRPPRTLA